MCGVALILQFRLLSPSKRLPIKSVVLKIPHMLRLVIFYQDGKAAGVYFGLLAKGGADNQVRAVVQDISNNSTAQRTMMPTPMTANKGVEDVVVPAYSLMSNPTKISAAENG